MAAAPARAAWTSVAKAGRVRAFAEADVPAVARLHEQVFGHSQSQRDAVESYLEEIFWAHPWDRDGYPSLVYEVGRRIVGCLGVMPRRMVFRSRPIVMAVGHHFMVEPECRSSTAALELLRAFLSGPQHLSLAEGNDASRTLWEAARGATSWLYSLRWIRPLRPARYLVEALRRQGLPPAAAACLRPVTSALDLLTVRTSQHLFAQAPAHLSAADLDDATLATLIRDLARHAALGPHYEVPALAWLLGQLDRKRHYGRLQRVVLRNRAGEVAGWYLYYLRPGGTSEVVQLAGHRRSLGDVLDHLLAHARAGGAVAVSGRLDPSLMPILAARQCFYRAGGSWMLVDSSDREILGAIHRGDAFLTRLEGEWWIGYGNETTRRDRERRRLWRPRRRVG